jgi:hypothetical protein
MWQALETKARFIAQVMTGDSTVRRAEDIGGQEFSYAEVKAIASGNPAVLTLAEANAELQRLAVLKRNHADEQFIARRNVRDLPGRISDLNQRITGLERDMATAAAHADDQLVVNTTPVSRSDEHEALASRLKRTPERISDSQRFRLGFYRGLEFGLMLHPHGSPAVYLAGAISRQELLTRDTYGPRAILNALDRLAGSYRPQLERAREELSIAAAQLRDYQARLGAAFAHEEYMQTLAGVRDQLKAVLSGTMADANGQPLPTSQELDEHIKSLKAAHTIDASPKRTGSRLADRSDAAAMRRVQRRPPPLPAASSPPSETATAESTTAQPHPEWAIAAAAATAATDDIPPSVQPSSADFSPRRVEHIVPRFLADRPAKKRQQSLF